ncbi:MAG: 50S ribosomal protein L11 methyltransferase [Candidatus Promineifilaceae bacterium]
MNKLHPTTQLKRRSQLQLELKTNGHVLLRWDNQQLKSGRHTLAILEAFREPKTLKAAIAQLQSAGHADWIALTMTIRQLFAAGVLQDADAPTLLMAAKGFGNPSIHIAMLNDRARTALYLQAIAESVRAGDVVVDLGTGSGILAMAAARAGAAQVYAIEANSAMADVAQANFDRNGLSGRITLCRGWSTQVELPQKADILISEIIGNNPLDEQILTNVEDARRRLLKPDARMVPERLAVWGLPVTIPENQIDRVRVSAETLASWQAKYGFDLAGLMEMAIRPNAPLFTIKPQKARNWPRLSHPIQLADIDLRTFTSPQIDTTQQRIATTNGTVNGLLLYFCAALNSQTMLSTHPDDANASNHWRSPVWATSTPFTVKQGDAFSVCYQANLQHKTQVRIWRDS